MRKFKVFDWQFNFVGYIVAKDAEQALMLAKAKYRHVTAPMVEEDGKV